MADKNAFIGVFDSGVGGLGVLNTLLKILPDESYLYIADSAHFPYGTKSAEQIKEYSEKIVQFLLKKNVKAIVVACNTVSSVALPYLKEISGDVPVFGMVQSGAEIALKTTDNLRIGIISTPLTAKMHAYKNEIMSLNESAEVFEVGSQELVNLVEDGNAYKEEAYLLAKNKLSGVLGKKIDTLVLGCTHFPFLYKVVKKVVGNGVKVVDPASEVGNALMQFLVENNLSSDEKEHKRVFLTTGDTKNFLDKAKIFLNISVKDVEHIDI